METHKNCECKICQAYEVIARLRLNEQELQQLIGGIVLSMSKSGVEAIGMYETLKFNMMMNSLDSKELMKYIKLDMERRKG